MVTILVIILVTFGFFVGVLRPFIPKPKPNSLINDPSDYIQNASTQPIQWHKLSKSIFDKAKKEDKLVFLALGSMGCSTARAADDLISSSWELTERLRQNFICTRVDLDQNPEYKSLFLPFQRSIIGFDPDLQFWILTAQGKPIDATVNFFGKDQISYAQLHQTLVNAEQYTSNSNNENHRLSSLKNLFDLERTLLFNTNKSSLLNFQRHYHSVKSKLDLKQGGYLIQDVHLLRPWVWKYLLQYGDTQLAVSSIDRLFRSGLYDYVFGGFFQQSRNSDFNHIEFDKQGISNAEMALLMAQIYCILRYSNKNDIDNSLFFSLSRQTCLMLLNEFMQNDCFVAYQESDENVFGISKRYSMTKKFLTTSLDWPERNWIQKRFNLNIKTNPQLLLRANNFNDYLLHRDLYSDYIERIKRKKDATSNSQYGGRNLCYVNGSILAKLIETSYLLADDNILNKCLVQFRTFRDQFYRDPNCILHTKGSITASYYIGDYLSYCEAAFQYYKVTGDHQVLLEGFQTLICLLKDFHNNKYKLPLQNKFNNYDLSFLSTGPIALSDCTHEASISSLIRLLFIYGKVQQSKMFIDLIANDAPNLINLAKKYAAVAAAPMEETQYDNSSYYTSSLQLQQNRCLIVSGHYPFSKAQEISQKHPSEFIIPHVSPSKEMLNTYELTDKLTSYNEGRRQPIIRQLSPLVKLQ
jgi:uncharacterized protein YyaL (SSP411 family)